jgi:hypothetical protein
MHDPVTLTPAQQAVTDRLLGGIRAGGPLVLKSAPGMGRTTILRKVHETTGGALLSVSSFLQKGSRAIEEAFLYVMDQALHNERLAIVDDLHLLLDSLDWQRKAMVQAAMTAVLDMATDRGQTVLFGFDQDDLPATLQRRSHVWTMAAFGPEDYEHICRNDLGTLDYARVHRFAPSLNGHQLHKACCWLRGRSALNTDGLIDYLKSQNLASNVEIEEVPAVDWNDLKGVDDVIQALEAKIALPLEMTLSPPSFN